MSVIMFDNVRAYQKGKFLVPSGLKTSISECEGLGKNILPCGVYQLSIMASNIAATVPIYNGSFFFGCELKKDFIRYVQFMGSEMGNSDWGTFPPIDSSVLLFGIDSDINKSALLVSNYTLFDYDVEWTIQKYV